MTKILTKIELMKTAGRLGRSIFRRVGYILEAGITTQKLNDAAKSSLEFHEAVAAFKGYCDFPAETCISLNEEICHGMPGKRIIGGGDLVSINIGIQVGDYIVDACQTYEVGEISEEADHLNYWTRVALKRALRHIKAGVCWNNIARIIENTATNKGLGVIKEMTGHGIGEKLHEDPVLRNYTYSDNKHIVLKEGQTICVEPMFSLGTGECEIAHDGWTVVTKDRTLASHWEHCIVITKTGCEILL